jgi:hypothetical protein
MPTATADVFSIADRIEAEISARITDLTFAAATVEGTEELSIKAEDCPADGSLIVFVIGVDEKLTRNNRAAECETGNVVIVQVAALVSGEQTAAKRRSPGNYAVAIYKHFFKNANYNATTGDCLVDSESEMLFLFEDDVFAGLGVAMAAFRLTYRNQAVIP